MKPNEASLNEKYREYRVLLVERFWDFHRGYFRGQEGLFEKAYDREKPVRPPVFQRDFGEMNVLLDGSLDGEGKKAVRDMIPTDKWHRWFTSMTSSQALAQSVFGNLSVVGKLNSLADLKGDDGKPLFFSGNGSPASLEMEHEITYLNEPRRTKIDVFFGGDHQVAIECKLSEREVGSCSRPRLSKSDAQYCDGSYCFQGKRTKRCSLSQIGVEYWEHIPEFFSWHPDIDHNPCPLNETYQLVRNVLAACLRASDVGGAGGNAEPTQGHAVLLYDERNPEFQTGGKGFNAWHDVKKALKKEMNYMLQKCTWQQVIQAMERDAELSWLVKMLREKYGF